MGNFTTMARLVSHLGDQLISNTTVAILELIKNAYDATVAADNPNGFIKIEINQENRTMTIEDNGHGMTKDDVDKKYLVIGTTDRLESKELIKEQQRVEKINIKAPQGEKGLGRFATMKLGRRIVLLTKSSQSKFGCLIGINWDQFGYSSRKRLDEVKIHQFLIDEDSLKKRGYSNSFTKMKIYGLKDFCDPSDWTPQAFEAFYKKNFSKFLNPFRPSKGFQIKLEVTTAKGDFFRFYPEILEKKLLNQAPYQLKGLINNQELQFDYYIRGEDGKEHSGNYRGHIVELTKKSFEDEGLIGPVEFELYFYNRTAGRLKEIKGYENISQIRSFLDQYCGGIMIYRDRFRVLPYAQPGNDWLQLDSKSQFTGKGIRFNTVQTVGAIYIDTFSNPNLRDQTNREGLVNNKAYDNLKISLWSTLSTFKNIIKTYYPPEQKKKGPIVTEEIHDAIKPLKDKLVTVSEDLVRLNTFSKTFSNDEFNEYVFKFKNNCTNLQSEYEKLIETLQDFDNKIKKVDEQQRMIIDLAGVGMTAETVAHELWSYLGRITYFLNKLKYSFPSELDTIKSLLHNTKALETVISRLDIQTITKKRTKSKINILSIVKDLCKSKSDVWNSSQDENIDIVWDFEENCIIKGNQGMIVQVFDNLLNNSRYWLLKHNESFPSASLEIHISILKDGIIEVSDTGFGISELDSSAVFEPFFTRKKPGDGRGLGLYIVQELLNFHDADIILCNERNKYGRLYKFLIDFSKCLVE